ncbi:hypothetical protein KO505_04665 [Psychrosphaera sp. F3M07]|uniref:hypothetical protein n=1 Tax=Psychrosphaera sp. F3M07 TaxID=2841560 RepID=UPI001C0843B7|nr:hypothetical protein [Psychrosphaera sp. F3M07]MBU2917258.1 hypothetical protein [Psychrosphaera sp. F3M07]
MLFKLLFIVSVLLSTVSATEIASNSGHDLSFTEINMITLDELANPELDLENPSALLHRKFNWILASFKQSTLHYQQPFHSQLRYTNTYSRAPPTYFS